MVSYKTILADNTASYIIPLAYVYASTSAGYMSGLAFIDYYGSNGGLNLYGENGSLYTLLTASIMIPNSAVYDLYNNYLLVYGSPYIGSVMVYNLMNGSYYFVGLSNNQIVGGALYTQYPTYYNSNASGYTVYLYDSVGSYFHVENGDYNSTWGSNGPVHASETLISVAPLYIVGWGSDKLKETVYIGGTYASNGSIFQFVYDYIYAGLSGYNLSYSSYIPYNVAYGMGANASIIAFHWYNAANPSQIMIYIGKATPWTILNDIDNYSSHVVASVPYVPSYSSLLVYGNYILIGLGSPINEGTYLYLYDYLSGSTFLLGSYTYPYIYLGTVAPNSVYYSINSGNGTGASLIQLLFDYPVDTTLNININPVFAGSSVTVYTSITYTDGSPASNLLVNYYVFAGIGAGNQKTGLHVGNATTNSSGIASKSFVMPPLQGYNYASAYIMVEVAYSA